MRELVKSRRFEAQLGRAFARGLTLEDWEHLGYLLMKEDILPPEYDEHMLHGPWKGHWECHLGGDLLVAYRRTTKAIIFKAIGSHKELFKDPPRSYAKFQKQRPRGWWRRLDT
ncbi:MAG TPA: type II toxin-antitoxin system YafQ family toxin [Opitutales bacterium]|nr:type II toxin-antitoxin system YafQ family toxin [Opitutales bacterium]